MRFLTREGLSWTNYVDTRKRWKQYNEDLLNVEDKREEAKMAEGISGRNKVKTALAKMKFREPKESWCEET